MTWSEQDLQHMARAIRLAERGLFSTHPNPRVGCVLVKDGEIVGEGYHERAGEAHAEVHAIASAGDAARGATAFVTLEPCSHYGRTPPCAEALLKAGVARVVAAMLDPNPLVSGSGLQMLKEQGVQVAHGLLEESARKLNPGFIKRMVSKKPYVRLKSGISLDGRTGMASGESQWITGAAAREDVQRLRARSSAVLTGIGTLLHDNPRLTVRLPELLEVRKRQPDRVILDAQGNARGSENVFAPDAKVFYFSPVGSEPPRLIADSDHVECIRLPLDSDGHFDLDSVLLELGAREINEVMVEAGAGLVGDFIKQECFDELWVYMAPKLLGASARPLANLNLSAMSQAIELDTVDVRVIGNDLRLIYRLSET